MLANGCAFGFKDDIGLNHRVHMYARLSVCGCCMCMCAGACI